MDVIDQSRFLNELSGNNSYLINKSVNPQRLSSVSMSKFDKSNISKIENTNISRMNVKSPKMNLTRMLSGDRSLDDSKLSKKKSIHLGNLKNVIFNFFEHSRS